MSDIILYPTETLYALGVTATEPEALNKLFELKGRDASKAASWLVRDIADIERYAVLGDKARKIAERFLPGQLTLVLKCTDAVSLDVTAPDHTIGFRISRDPIAQQIITAYMQEYDAPLTCTSANVSGAPAFPTVEEILQQFGERAEMITEMVDDGPRKGLASTVVRCVDDEVSVLREGEISESDITQALR
ncbi:L-threonylcarbamoyladenylate synthase [Candidatus Pacebacteria bacterium]|nr:L-threonylcarbamoyladenylate synthase [Candidatus Paceibacterota bacterium]